MTAPILAPHQGAHAAVRRPSIFRRAIAAVRRKPAAAGTTLPAAAAAEASPYPAHYERRDGDIVVTPQDEIVIVRDPAARPVNGRLLGDLPRRKPIRNRQPWQTAAMPAVPTQAEIHEQYMISRRRHPVFGEAPVARVLGLADLGPADAQGRTLGERMMP